MTATTDRAAFLAERATGLGGSDAHDYLNLEPYGCRLRLWYQKRAIDPDYPDEAKAVFERGTKCEPLVAEKYAEITGRKISFIPVHRREDFPFLLVHTDRIIDAIPEHDGDGVLELKTANREVFFKMRREGLPVGYIAQMQHALMVTGLKWGSFGVLWLDGWQFIQFDVERDESVIPILLDEAVDFWKLVDNGPAPDRLDPDDRRCQSCCYRRSCQGAALMDAGPDDGDVPADESMRPLLMEYDERKALADEAGGLLDETKEVIRVAMGERPAVRVAGRAIYHRKQVSMRMDTKLFDGCYPELVKYVRELVDSARERGVADQVIERVVNRIKTAGDFKRASESRPLRVY